MLQLFIDTSTDKALVGLAHRNEIVEVQVLEVGMQNSKFLFPALLDLLNKNKFTPKDLQLIGCGVGPGSYTGIRVGAATAQSMAYALRLPLVGISSLEAYAPSNEGSFAVLFDARYGGIYYQIGKMSAGKVEFDAEPHVVALTECQEKLKGIQTFVTPHSFTLKERIDHLFPEVIWEDANPSSKAFARRIYDQYNRGDYSSKAELQLLYLKNPRIGEQTLE